MSTYNSDDSIYPDDEKGDVTAHDINNPLSDKIIHMTGVCDHLFLSVTDTNDSFHLHKELLMKTIS